MDYFLLGNPDTALRLAKDRYADDIRRTEWRIARRLEREQRAQYAARHTVSEQLVSRPAPRTGPSWSTWRGMLRSIGFAGS